jgi:hypothetical protein
MNRLMIVLSAVSMGLLAAVAGAADLYPWNNHEPPLSFIFGNEIDGHQQSRRSAQGELTGFLYVRFNGVRSSEGYRIATHADCTQASDCTVGWDVEGRAVSATLLYRPTHDHPVFLVERADLPQPGAYSHFHWPGEMPAVNETRDGYLFQLFGVDTFCFVHHEADQAAASDSCRANGGIVVSPGLDAASHLNIVTSAPSAAL